MPNARFHSMQQNRLAGFLNRLHKVKPKYGNRRRNKAGPRDPNTLAATAPRIAQATEPVLPATRPRHSSMLAHRTAKDVIHRKNNIGTKANASPDNIGFDCASNPAQTHHVANADAPTPKTTFPQATTATEVGRGAIGVSSSTRGKDRTGPIRL